MSPQPLLSTLHHTDLSQDAAGARGFLIEALRLVDATWPVDRSPFPGLRPFDADQHQVFFGRADETRELAKLLRSPAEHVKGAALLVVGPPGCDKSSLVRAGLVPVMAADPGWWALEPMVPGADPVAALSGRWPPPATTPRCGCGTLTGLNDLRRHAVGWACAIAAGGLDPDQWRRFIFGLPYENTCPG